MISPPPPDFDGLARWYRLLEFAAFGRDLERARFRFLPCLRECRDILILGEGDGRCLARLAPLAPAAGIRCIDASAAMLRRAAGRLGAVPPRIRLEQGDALAADLPAAAYDAAITFFFLDCFQPPEAEALLSRVIRSLRPGAALLWADFAVPERGWARWRGQAWLALLYGFFRWRTGIAARALPPAEAALRRAGLLLEAEEAYQGGLIRTAIWRVPPSAG